jgi:polar amino acid transport system substrate-binding protein
MKSSPAVDSLRRRLLKAAGWSLSAQAWFLEAPHAAQSLTLWDTIRKRGVLNTVTEMQFAPCDMIVRGEYVGSTRDTIDAVGEDLKLKIVYNDIPWDGILPGLDAGRFDLCIAPVMATRQRMLRYSFTNPIGAATPALIKRVDDKTIVNAKDIAGKIVGTQRGSHVITDLRTFSSTLPQPVDIRQYLDAGQAYADLESGRLDAVSNSSLNLTYLAAQRPEMFALVQPAFGTPTYLCWVARHDDTALVHAVNGALGRLTESGRMAVIQQKWFGVVTPLPILLPPPLG